MATQAFRLLSLALSTVNAVACTGKGYATARDLPTEGIILVVPADEGRRQLAAALAIELACKGWLVFVQANEPGAASKMILKWSAAQAALPHRELLTSRNGERTTGLAPRSWLSLGGVVGSAVNLASDVVGQVLVLVHWTPKPRDPGALIPLLFSPQDIPIDAASVIRSYAEREVKWMSAIVLLGSSTSEEEDQTRSAMQEVARQLADLGTPSQPRNRDQLSRGRSTRPPMCIELLQPRGFLDAIEQVLLGRQRAAKDMSGNSAVLLQVPSSLKAPTVGEVEPSRSYASANIDHPLFRPSAVIQRLLYYVLSEALSLGQSVLAFGGGAVTSTLEASSRHSIDLSEHDLLLECMSSVLSSRYPRPVQGLSIPLALMTGLAPTWLLRGTLLAARLVVGAEH